MNKNKNKKQPINGEIKVDKILYNILHIIIIINTAIKVTDSRRPEDNSPNITTKGRR